MVINKYEHGEAIEKIIKALPESVKADEKVSAFIKGLKLAIGKHYCVAHMHYVEDGMYDFDYDPEQFATREEAEKYLEEECDSCYYDDEKKVYVEDGVEYPDDYVAEDEGMRLWVAEG
jgi:hypothetical protein